MRKVSYTGNSLAYLLCQEQKSATADVRVVQMRKASPTGNSLAYLLCQEQKCATPTFACSRTGSLLSARRISLVGDPRREIFATLAAHVGRFPDAGNLQQFAGSFQPDRTACLDHASLGHFETLGAP
jgi:hypothetical protein